MKNERGASLVELLMMTAIFIGLLPLAYNQMAKRNEQRAIFADAEKLTDAQGALLRYISDNEKKLTNISGTATYRIRAEELTKYGLPETAENMSFRIIKSGDTGGRSYLQGIVLSDLPGASPLRTRRVALAAGSGAGYVADGRIYGAHGDFDQRLGLWKIQTRSKSAVAAETPVVWKTRDFLYRTKTGRASDNAMKSDLDMNNHAMNEIGLAYANTMRVLETLQADWLQASNISFMENISLNGGFLVAGTSNVLGNLTAESTEIISNSNIVIGNMAKFRSVDANRLKTGSLALEWAGSSIAPGVIEIGQHLGLSNGSITTETANIGGSGATTTSLYVSLGILDPTDPSYYWDFNERSAALQDLQLINLGPLMRAVISSESANGVKTEMERALQPVASNANATASDYLRALNNAIKKVEQKYESLGLE